MNTLTAPDWTQAKGRAVGAVLSFLHAVGGKPNVRRPREVLWEGTIADLREGVAVNADDPNVCPATDDEMVALLHHARPLLRQHHFKMSPRNIEVDSYLKVTPCQRSYRPAWDR